MFDCYCICDCWCYACLCVPYGCRVSADGYGSDVVVCHVVAAGVAVLLLILLAFVVYCVVVGVGVGCIFVVVIVDVGYAGCVVVWLHRITIRFGYTLLYRYHINVNITYGIQ